MYPEGGGNVSRSLATITDSSASCGRARRLAREGRRRGLREAGARSLGTGARGRSREGNVDGGGRAGPDRFSARKALVVAVGIYANANGETVYSTASETLIVVLPKGLGEGVRESAAGTGESGRGGEAVAVALRETKEKERG